MTLKEEDWKFLVFVIVGFSLYISFYLLNVLLKRIMPNQNDVKIREKWGQYLPSKTGRSWSLPRYDPNRKDSKPLLEKHGFTILGITDEVLYRVEPPVNWEMKFNNNLYSSVHDEHGKKVLLVFVKNDIMNPSDYKGCVSEV